MGNGRRLQTHQTSEAEKQFWIEGADAMETQDAGGASGGTRGTTTIKFIMGSTEDDQASSVQGEDGERS